MEGKHEFVHLEDTETGVFVDVEGELVDDRSEPGLEDWIFLGIAERVVEDSQVGC